MNKRTKWMCKLFLALLTCISSVGYACVENNLGYCCDNEEYMNYARPSFFRNFHNSYVDAELLFWNAHEDGLQYAANGFDLTKGHHDDLDWKWKPGFRVGVGTLFGCNDWDLSLTYTWYKNKANNSTFDPTGDTLGTWSEGAQRFTDLSGDLHLIFQTLDLALKKAFYVCDYFIVEPVVALRGAFIKERYNIDYVNTIDVTFQNIRNSQRFHAVGTLLGVNTRWIIYNQLSLIAEGAFSILYGRYDVNRFSEFADNNIQSNFNTLRSVIQSRFGFGWTRCVYFGELDIQVLWEQQKWINHNQMLYGPLNFDQFVQNRNTDLSLYGITLKAQLTF